MVNIFDKLFRYPDNLVITIERNIEPDLLETLTVRRVVNKLRVILPDVFTNPKETTFLYRRSHNPNEYGIKIKRK